MSRGMRMDEIINEIISVTPFECHLDCKHFKYYWYYYGPHSTPSTGPNSDRRT